LGKEEGTKVTDNRGQKDIKRVKKGEGTSFFNQSHKGMARNQRTSENNGSKGEKEGELSASVRKGRSEKRTPSIRTPCVFDKGTAKGTRGGRI